MTGKQFRGVVLFTAIEVVTLVGWLALARGGENLLSALVLTVGLLVEHAVSVNVGANRPPFSLPGRE